MFEDAPGQRGEGFPGFPGRGGLQSTLVTGGEGGDRNRHSWAHTRTTETPTLPTPETRKQPGKHSEDRRVRIRSGNLGGRRGEETTRLTGRGTDAHSKTGQREAAYNPKG